MVVEEGVVVLMMLSPAEHAVVVLHDDLLPSKGSVSRTLTTIPRVSHKNTWLTIGEQSAHQVRARLAGDAEGRVTRGVDDRVVQRLAILVATLDIERGVRSAIMTDFVLTR